MISKIRNHGFRFDKLENECVSAIQRLLLNSIVIDRREGGRLHRF